MPTLNPNGCLGMRHVQCIFLALLMIIVGGIRNSLSVAVIAMVSENPPHEYIPTYPEWASKKNVMLSAFFWGYVVFQIVAGEVARKYGPKLLLGISILINSIFCVLLPLFGSQFGYLGVIACRIIQGLSQGSLLPCCHHLLSKWIPSKERARLGNFVYAGSPLGIVIALPAAGAISSSSAGWPAVFYIYGGVGIVWSAVWFVFGSDSPLTDRFVSEKEKNYIQHDGTSDEDKKVPTPWKAIFASAPFYAIPICQCGQNLGYGIMLTETPSYMEKILNFSLTSSSILTALPYFVEWMFSSVLSLIADTLILRNVLSVGTSRKLCNSIGMLIPAAALCSLVFVQSQDYVVILVILVIAVGFNGGTISGFMINHIDISPVHAGTLMGIANTIGYVFALIAPLLTDIVAKISGYNESQKQLWNILFSIASAVYLVSGLSFILMGSGEEQFWSLTEDRKFKELNV